MHSILHLYAGSIVVDTMGFRSLPLEVVELEKHVKDLSVKQNPLSVLPSKWHAHFGPKEEASAPPGYTHGEVGAFGGNTIMRYLRQG